MVQHNSFFNILDHLALIIRSEFSDSKVAKKFTSGKTKTAAIVNSIGDYFFEELKSSMEENPFSIMLDGSNDNGLEKMYPITVRIYDVRFNRVMTKFFSMNLLEGTDASTAACMFDSVNNQFEENGISWDHCMAIGLDNTNANIGQRNSIKSRAREKNPEIIIAGCPCHILHNASCKGSIAFSKCTGFDITDHCVDLYHWFDKSSKRKNILKEYYDFCDIEYGEIIKLVSTRWLCLEMCVNRELKKFEGLQSFFKSEEYPGDKRFERLQDNFNDKMLEVYLLFYHAVLPCFTNFNKLLQKEEPLIYTLHDAQQRFMNKLASRFVKPEVIQIHKEENISFSSLPLSFSDQKDDINLGIGFLTRQQIQKLLNEGDITEAQVDVFYDGVRQFFCHHIQAFC